MMLVIVQAQVLDLFGSRQWALGPELGWASS